MAYAVNQTYGVDVMLTDKTEAAAMLKVIAFRRYIPLLQAEM